MNTMCENQQTENRFRHRKLLDPQLDAKVVERLLQELAAEGRRVLSAERKRARDERVWELICRPERFSAT